MDILQVAFIGSGRIAKIHANILQEIKLYQNLNIRGCYSTTSKNTQKFCDSYGCKIYASFEDLISDDIDCVYICIPPGANGIYEKQLIVKNISFFVEKPIGLVKNINQIGENVIFLKKYMASIKVGYQWKYRKFIDLIQQFISEQDFCYFIYNRHALKPLVTKDDEENLFGGPLFSNLSHVVNMITYLFNNSDINVGNTFCEKDKGFFSTTLYSKNCFCSINYLGSLVNKDCGGLIEIFGNKGKLSVKIDDNFQYSLNISSSKGFNEIHREEKSEGEYYREDIEFIENVRDKKVYYQEYLDAYRTLDILIKINKKIVEI